MTKSFDPEVDPARGLALLGGEPLVLHCHHYNCFLQHVVLEQAGRIDAPTLLTPPAAEVALSQLRAIDATREDAEEVFRTLGFGRLAPSRLPEEGGDVVLRSSHYGMGWIS